MVAVEVEIVRYIDTDFPGWVECRLVDAAGREWCFKEKVPVVITADLQEGSHDPQPGVIACRLLCKQNDALGREVVTIDTELPWGFASINGQTHFDVLPQQLTE